MALREYRGRPAPGGRPGHHLQHVLACGAMLYMLLAATGTAAGTAGSTMSGMGGASGGAAQVRTLALVLAFALFGYVVWNADRLSSLPPVAALAALADRVVPVPLLAGTPAGGGAASDHDVSRLAARCHHAGEGSGSDDAGPSSAGSGVQGRSVPLSPRLAACCEIAMGVSMGYMLILML